MNSLYEATLAESPKEVKIPDNTKTSGGSEQSLTPEAPENSNNIGANVNNDKDTDSCIVEANSQSDNTTPSQPNGTITNTKPEKTISHPLEINSDDEDDRLFNEQLLQTTKEPPEVKQPPQNPSRRRVFFPDDHRIVSGYMDPPRPWNDASTLSTEELIQAYKQACDRFGVKPLPRLLQQLQVINDFTDRNETLTLRGERLDAKHCETVEEILRRVQFRTIDFEGTHLEEEGAVALFDMIEHYESCTRLNISHNRTVGIRGWQACARLLKKTPCLEILEARNCTIAEQVMPFLCRSLKLGSMLTTLHLENSISSGRPLILLVTALKMNDFLRELYLADNKLMPSDGIQLGNLLRYNFRLQLLDLRNNHLQDVGTSHICDGVWEQNMGHGLSTLVLWNNQVTYQSMKSLSRALANTKSLETLNLGYNNVTNEGIHRLKDGLLQNKSLLRIGLQAAKVSCEGAVALAEFIAESPRLLRIDLRENDIKTGGLMALSLSLKVSESVTRIDLDKETKRETSMKDYAEQQRRLLNDISNFMARNRDAARHREEEEERQRILAAAAPPPEEPPNNDDDTPEKQDEEKPVDDEDKENIEDSSKSVRPDSLDLALGGRSHTLDSPAVAAMVTSGCQQVPQMVFTPEEASPDSPESPSDQMPLDYPPSPMVSENGRPTLAPILGCSPSLISPVSHNSGDGNTLMKPQQEVARKSPSSSPTMSRRKFIISRVQEPRRSKDSAQPKDDDSTEASSPQHSDNTDPLSSDPLVKLVDSFKDTDRLEDNANNDDELIPSNSFGAFERQLRDSVELHLAKDGSLQIGPDEDDDDETSETKSAEDVQESNGADNDSATRPSDGEPSAKPLDDSDSQTSPPQSVDDVHISSSQESQHEQDSAKVQDLSTLNGVRKDFTDATDELGDLQLGVDIDLKDIPQSDSVADPEDFEKELDAMLATMAEPTAS